MSTFSKKTYFISDFHLGVDARLTSLARERKIVKWLEFAAQDAAAIYLVGDIFDFWFEYKTVIPKGYTRILGKLAALRDAGLPIFFFTGNHDMWMFRYLETEMGIPIYRAPIVREIGGKKFFIGHGDGLGPGDYGYKFIKKVFANPICQWFFERLHPNFGVGLANYWSGKSRTVQNKKRKHPVETFYGEENEWLLTFANEQLGMMPDIDFFIFGHRHLPIDWRLKNNHSRYINLGEWLNLDTYAVFDGNDISIHFFENEGIIHSNWK